MRILLLFLSFTCFFYLVAFLHISSEWGRSHHVRGGEFGSLSVLLGVLAMFSGIVAFGQERRIRKLEAEIARRQ